MRNIHLDMLKRLTDAYSKDEYGNTGKLFKIISDEQHQINAAMEKIRIFRDLDNATGRTLDKIGSNFRQHRGVLDDDLYRIMIKVKVMRNLSDGGINTLISIFSFLFQIDKSEVKINEMWPDEPAAMTVTVPPGALNRTGLSLDQFGQLADSVAAGGVGISTLFLGTFQFSSQPTTSEMDGDKGFGDIEGTTGGYFGAYFDKTSGELLPF
jgi:hypothetical protein